LSETRSICIGTFLEPKKSLELLTGLQDFQDQRDGLIRFYPVILSKNLTDFQVRVLAIL